jgi:hypothetical protein
MSEYEINKEVVFSTAHITRDESMKLSSSGLWFCDDHEYGFRILVSMDEEMLDGETEKLRTLGMTNVARLMRIASGLGCKWLVLDTDGDQYEEHPVFDWSE